MGAGVPIPGRMPCPGWQPPPAAPQPLAGEPILFASHLQHGTDPAASQHLQQLCEVCEALWCGLHLPLEPEPGVMRAWPGTPETLLSQAKPSPRDPQLLSQILPRLAPAQGQTVGRARRESTRKQLESGWKGGPSREIVPTPRANWAPNLFSTPCPPRSHLKSQREQHVQEGSHVVSISHPDLKPQGISVGPCQPGLWGLHP